MSVLPSTMGQPMRQDILGGSLNFGLRNATGSLNLFVIPGAFEVFPNGSHGSFYARFGVGINF
jgi:hypothetical protein